jgi:hypothetical protein
MYFHFGISSSIVLGIPQTRDPLVAFFREQASSFSENKSTDTLILSVIADPRIESRVRRGKI